MASVKYGGGVVQISGSIGGSTFARNRYGNYIRPRTKPVNPNTAAQVKIRNAIAQLTEEWYDTLDAAQRAAWKTYAANVAMKNKLGETIHLSGFNQFIRSNAARLYHDQVIVPDGPVIFTLPDKDPSAYSDNDESPNQTLIYYNAALDWANETGGFLLFYQGIPQNPTRDFFAGPWHYAGRTIGVTGAPPASPGMAIVHWAMAEGQRVWHRLRIMRADGRLSEPWQIESLVHSQAPGEVPLLIGLTEAQAVEALTAAELILGNVTTENSETVPVDIIISQDPVVHTRLEVGASVDIVVSLGPPA